LIIVREIVFADPTPVGTLTPEQATELYTALGNKEFRCTLAPVGKAHSLSVEVNAMSVGELEALIETVKEVIPNPIFQARGRHLEIQSAA